MLHLYIGMSGDAVSLNYITQCNGCFEYESDGVFRIDFDAVLFPTNIVAPELNQGDRSQVWWRSFLGRFSR